MPEVGGSDQVQLGAALLRKMDLPEAYQEVVEFHHNPSKAIRFSVEVTHFHLVDFITNELKLGCSRENEIIPKIDEGPWDRARAHHNINMAAIKNEVEDIFKETARVFLSH
jgi:HD-like signal output (HDOD) protein